MLIWKGWGILSALIPVVVVVGFVIGIELLMGPEYYDNAPWPFPLSILISGILVFLVGRRLNDGVQFKNTHSLFWIPMQYWGILALGIGGWFFLVETGIV